MTGFLMDAHIHLSDPEYQLYMDYVISAMKKLGLKACCVSVDYDTCNTTLKLAQKTDTVFPFVGIHPQTVSSSSPVDISSSDFPFLPNDYIEQNKDAITGIGEIGLDRTYVSSEEDFAEQIRIFEYMLNTAEKLQKPVSIHSRKTLDKILELLPSFSIRGVLLHWFDGNKRQLRQIMDLGYFVSFGMATLYSKDKQVLFSRANHELVLVETDGPVKFSHAFSYKPAQVAFLPSLVYCLSLAIKKRYDDLASQLQENSKRYLGI